MNIPLNLMGFKVRRQKFGVRSLIFLLLFGAAFAGVGLLVYSHMQIDPSWTKIQGTVADVSSHNSDGSTTYSPVVAYQVQGQTYRVAGSTSSGNYPAVGSQREVAYNPARPAQSKVVESRGIMLVTLLVPAIGIVVMLLAPFLFLRSLGRSRKIKNLMQNGRKLQGVLVEVKSISNNSNSEKIIVAATDLVGIVRQYESDPLSGAASLAMVDFKNNPVPIDVYIDPADPGNYYVDISDIPNLTPQRIAELIKAAVGKQQPPGAAPTEPQ